MKNLCQRIMWKKKEEVVENESKDFKIENRKDSFYARLPNSLGDEFAIESFNQEKEEIDDYGSSHAYNLALKKYNSNKFSTTTDSYLFYNGNSINLKIEKYGTNNFILNRKRFDSIPYEDLSQFRDLVKYVETELNKNLISKETWSELEKEVK